MDVGGKKNFANNESSFDYRAKLMGSPCVQVEVGQSPGVDTFIWIPTLNIPFNSVIKKSPSR